MKGGGVPGWQGRSSLREEARMVSRGQVWQGRSSLKEEAQNEERVQSDRGDLV